MVAIILAAGASERMGVPKALLEIGSRTFIRHLVDVYRAAGVEKIVVVLRPDAAVIENELAGLDVTFVLNRHPEKGQLSSIVAGLEAARTFGPEGALIHPVDHPSVSTATINKLLEQYNQRRGLIVLPTCKGRRGHPVLFSSKLFDELMNARPDVGARSVVWAHRKDVTEVETAEEGVIRDIDTPHDYEHLQRHLSSSRRE